MGKTEQLTLGTSSATGTKKAYITNTFEEGTGRLKQSAVTDQTHGYELQELNYAYDEAGNVTSVLDPTTLGGTSAADNQCFAYDGHQRLTEAWTPRTADCSTSGRTTANLGGASPYWTSYEYQASGLRSTETTHATGGDTKKTYCYDGTRTHALAAVTTAVSCTGVTPTYAYDTTGNTTTRPDGSSSQSLVWNEEGDLGKLVEGSSTTGYVYDADGSLLIRRNTAGETVLYLGATEVHLDTRTSTAKRWAQRYYTAGESTVALRSNRTGTDTLTWLAADRHGTSALAVESTTQSVTKRYNTPFGGNRSGGTGTWADDKGFLGKTSDTDTGLTHLGAREYDPVTGRFISVDPVLSTDQGQSLNGYTYANDNPVTQSPDRGFLGLLRRVPQRDAARRPPGRRRTARRHRRARTPPRRLADRPLPGPGTRRRGPGHAGRTGGGDPGPGPDRLRTGQRHRLRRGLLGPRRPLAGLSGAGGRRGLLR